MFRVYLIFQILEKEFVPQGYTPTTKAPPSEIKPVRLHFPIYFVDIKRSKIHFYSDSAKFSGFCNLVH